MSHQASRKVHQTAPFMGTDEYNDNVDTLLDLYNEGRATLAQVTQAINDCKKLHDTSFDVSGAEYEAMTDGY